MASPQQSKPRYSSYPEIKEAPDCKYENKEHKNPVLTGRLLVMSSAIVASSNLIQKYLWNNAGFGVLRNISELKNYTPRFNPTVIPISAEKFPDVNAYTKLEAFKSPPENLQWKYYSIAEYHNSYLSGELTPLAVVQYILPLIRRDQNPMVVHSIAFITSNVEPILQAAEASTQRYKDGKSLGILDGIPLAVKDECDVAGYRTTSGRKGDEKFLDIKTETIWPIRRWEEAGAIVMGKTNMHELGADTTNNNPNWGTPRNPYNDKYYCGGSSGGSAYAVSSGLLPITHGVDGGGSIRIPASFCGVYGLKPSHGRVGECDVSVSVHGPLAASISDLEVAYRVMAVPDPNHPVTALFTCPRLHIEPRPKIIGICKPWFDRADPLVRDRCNQVVEYFRDSLGYNVVLIELPRLTEGQLSHAFTILSEMASAARFESPPPRNWLSDLNAANQILMTVGDKSPASDYILAQRMRQLLMSHLAHLFQRHPGLVIVTPTIPNASWPIAAESDLKYGISDGNSSIRTMEYAWLANFTGCPAISCPAGYLAPAKGKGVNEIPVGIMALGEWGTEDALIEWGRDAEKWLNEVYQDGRKKPANWVDVLKGARKSLKK